MQETLVTKTLPQDPTIEVLVPNYKEPILPVNHGGFGWYGLPAYNQEGQLICHECGVFFDRLGQHLRKHQLTASAYKERYGLRRTKGLVSLRARDRRRQMFRRAPDHQERMVALQKAGTAAVKARPPNRGYKNALELLNARDSCPQQILRRLIEASEVYGRAISVEEANRYDARLDHLTEWFFGSFNKAKQLAKLAVNTAGGQKVFTKQLVLEDMCAFFSRDARWPKYKDYQAGHLICSTRPVRRFGGLKALRQEAMALRETQQSNARLAESIPAFADTIEREQAGYARV